MGKSLSVSHRATFRREYMQIDRNSKVLKSPGHQISEVKIHRAMIR